MCVTGLRLLVPCNAVVTLLWLLHGHKPCSYQLQVMCTSGRSVVQGPWRKQGQLMLAIASSGAGRRQTLQQQSGLLVEGLSTQAEPLAALVLLISLLTALQLLPLSVWGPF